MTLQDRMIENGIKKQLKIIQKSDDILIYKKRNILEIHFKYGNYTEVVNFTQDGFVKEKNLGLQTRYLASQFFLYGFFNGKIKQWIAQ